MERLMKTLDGKKPQYHPDCFYLQWNKEDGYQAKWCTYSKIDRSKLKFSTRIKWKDMRMDLVLAADYMDEQFTVDMVNTYTNKSYLKSHLQKSIRRSNPYKALLTSWHFLDLDLADFLRRLAIIAIEDCLPLEGYQNIVWFMAALSKGYTISDVQICWILGYVYDLANCPKYEQFAPNTKIEIRNIKMRTLDEKAKNLVYSIVLRKSFGGMKSDKFMCLTSAQLWSARNMTKSLFLPLLERKTIFISPPIIDMKKCEWIIGAIDFHCCPNIITSMWEKHDEFTEAQIKDAIWHCSSSITNKENIVDDLHMRTPDKYLEVWKVIRKDFLSYAKFVLDKNG
jgi:hypothetical protein